MFERAKQVATPLVRSWLPGGYEENGQWVVKNPTREDRSAGSFKINLTTGAWNDYADDAYGHDAVSLYAYINGTSNYDAALEILTKYDATYFPGQGEIKRHDTWYQLTRGHREGPEAPPPQSNEVARWPLEIKVGQVWRAVMWIIRFVDENGKRDLPHTLWTDGKKREWRRCALKSVKYPLYGLRKLTENPNSRVVLYEGQKTAAVVQGIIGDDWVCVGWYGGAGNTALTDWEPLIGREVWYSFDGDAAGRKAIKALLDEIHVKAHLVYPPSDVPAGWDHADAVRDGFTKEYIEELLLAGNAAPASPPAICAPDNRPTRLETPISKDFKEFVLDSIFTITETPSGQTKYSLTQDWFFWLCDNDPVIKNCIKYDYTTGTKAVAYPSSDIFEAKFDDRLYSLGIPPSAVTPTTMDRMCRRITSMNARFNRVADYMDTLIAQHGPSHPDAIDRFMAVLDINVERGYNEDPEDHAKRTERVHVLYRELFDKFFMRMHGRIRGTRLTDEGEYFGLMENDIVPILEGPQGIGKTRLCRWLACDDELYIDLGSGMKHNFGNAETVKKIRGRLIAEIGEMKIMKTSDSVETIKSFISMKAATVDIKYVEQQHDIPMTASFIGTSNPDQYLSDDTGNRRFWPVKLKNINDEKLDKDLPYKIHAHYQAAVLKMAKEEIYDYCIPSKELVEFIESLRQDALITYSDYDVCIKMIAKWKDNNPQGGFICQADVEKMAMGDGYPTRISMRSFKRSVQDAGFTQEREYNATAGRSSKGWKWTPGGRYKDDCPF